MLYGVESRLNNLEHARDQHDAENFTFQSNMKDAFQWTEDTLKKNVADLQYKHEDLEDANVDLHSENQQLHLRLQDLEDARRHNAPKPETTVSSPEGPNLLEEARGDEAPWRATVTEAQTPAQTKTVPPSSPSSSQGP